MGYSAFLIFKLDEKKVIDIATKAFMSPCGFVPAVMYITYGEDMEIENKPLDMDILLSCLKESPRRVQMTNKVYDELPGYKRFTVEVNEGHKTFTLNWHNDNLDFLLSGELIENLLADDSFICGYCYNNDDAYSQKENYFRTVQMKEPLTYYDHAKKITIDMSQHHGRFVIVAGIQFMAAPIMWFGKPFEDIIPFELFKKFKYAVETKIKNAAVIKVSLFGLYDDPAVKANRAKQIEFWKFFNLNDRIQTYSAKRLKELDIDPVRSMREYIEKRKKKK